jgi:hypothetical protein
MGEKIDKKKEAFTSEGDPCSPQAHEQVDITVHWWPLLAEVDILILRWH